MRVMRVDFFFHNNLICYSLNKIETLFYSFIEIEIVKRELCILCEVSNL